jgi:hypothetical protein
MVAEPLSLAGGRLTPAAGSPKQAFSRDDLEYRSID